MCVCVWVLVSTCLSRVVCVCVCCFCCVCGVICVVTKRRTSSISTCVFRCIAERDDDRHFSALSVDLNVLRRVVERASGRPYADETLGTKVVRYYLDVMEPLRSVRFYGLDCQIPNKAAEVLSDCYGDWGGAPSATARLAQV